MRHLCGECARCAPRVARKLIVAGVAATVCLALLVVPARAGAASYRVSECDVDASVGAAWPIKYDSGGQCMRLEPFYDSRYDGSAFGSATISAPAGTYFGAASFSWHLGQALSYNAAVYGFAPGGGVRWAAFANGDAPSGGNASIAAVSSVAIHLSCPGGPLNSGCYDYGPYEADDVDRAVFGPFVFDVVDTVAPATPILGGELVDGSRQSGTRALTVDASDQGGGLSLVTIAVNGAQTSSFPSTCAIAAGTATRLQPCPATVHKDLAIDTSASPWHDGDNALEVCASDLATSGEAPARSCAQRTVTVGPPPPADTDADGCNDAEEAAIGTDPNSADTDGDGLGDCDELHAHSCLSPTNRDSDNDGVLDGADPEPCRGSASSAGVTGVASGGGGGGIPTLADCTARTAGTQHRDRLMGTAADDRLLGRGGNDLIAGFGGRNCLLGNRGRDAVIGGPEPDRLVGGPGDDRINARDGVRDRVVCGAGRHDRAKLDRIDLVVGCERLRFG
jgi:hypothetical protein